MAGGENSAIERKTIERVGVRGRLSWHRSHDNEITKIFARGAEAARRRRIVRRAKRGVLQGSKREGWPGS
nr:Hypothetical protein SC2p2_00140 [Methylocystis sp. SC2]